MHDNLVFQVKNFVALKKSASFAPPKERLHFSIQILFIKFKVPLVRVGLFLFYGTFARLTQENDIFLHCDWHHSC